MNQNKLLFFLKLGGFTPPCTSRATKKSYCHSSVWVSCQWSAWRWFEWILFTSHCVSLKMTHKISKLQLRSSNFQRKKNHFLKHYHLFSDCEHCSQLFILELPKEMQLCPSSYICSLNQILCVYFIFLIFIFFPTRHGNNESPRLSEYIPVGSELKEANYESCDK